MKVYVLKSTDGLSEHYIVEGVYKNRNKAIKRAYKFIEEECNYYDGEYLEHQVNVEYEENNNVYVSYNLSDAWGANCIIKEHEVIE